MYCRDKKEMDERKGRLLMKTSSTSSSAGSVLNVPDVVLLSAGCARSNGLDQQATQSEREREGEVIRRNEGECTATRGGGVLEGAAMKKDSKIGLETEKAN